MISPLERDCSPYRVERSARRYFSFFMHKNDNPPAFGLRTAEVEAWLSLVAALLYTKSDDHAGGAASIRPSIITGDHS